MRLEYQSDGQNRRVQMKYNGSSEKRWLYLDQQKIGAELNHNGEIKKSFIFATKVNTADYFRMQNESYKIVSDHLGSTRLVVNARTGQVMQQMNHDEFGVVTKDTNPGLTPFGFAGGLYDMRTKLVRFGARDYDPETGRWTSKDPILFAGGDTNLYGYVLNDPINKIDLTGLNSEIEIYDSGHAVLRVDDPSSPTGSSYVDFYPNEAPSLPFSVKLGVVDIDSSYGGRKRGSLGNCASTPEQDKQILQRAQNMSKNPPNYQTIPLGSNQNCYSAASLIQGGCK